MLNLETSQAENQDETYFALHTVKNDICLYLKIDWNEKCAVISKCLEDKWFEKITVRAPLSKLSTCISLVFRPGMVLISIDGERVLDWPVDVTFEQISSLHGSGLWSIDLAASFESNLPEEILPGLPLENNLITMHQPDLIYDFGMHNGDDTDFYLKKGFRVVAVDANPTLCANGSERFKAALEAKQLIICNIGIASARGMLSFYINHDISEWSSFDYDIASRGHDVCEIKVATATPYDFFNAFGIPYYCKIDIEGLDRLVVDAICGLKVKPQYVSFENGALRDFEALAAAGFSSFQLVEQSNVPKIRLTKPALEGKFVKHSFPSGSSGPFGRELKGEWLHVNEMRNILNEHHKSLNARSERGYDWWDLHACLA